MLLNWRTRSRRPLWRRGLCLCALLEGRKRRNKKGKKESENKKKLTAQRRHNLVNLTPVSAPLKRRGRYRFVSVDPRPNVLRSLERQWALVCLGDRGPNPSSDRSSLGNAGTGGRNIRLWNALVWRDHQTAWSPRRTRCERYAYQPQRRHETQVL